MPYANCASPALSLRGPAVLMSLSSRQSPEGGRIGQDFLRMSQTHSGDFGMVETEFLPQMMDTSHLAMLAAPMPPLLVGTSLVGTCSTAPYVCEDLFSLLLFKLSTFVFWGEPSCQSGHFCFPTSSRLTFLFVFWSGVVEGGQDCHFKIIPTLSLGKSIHERCLITCNMACVFLATVGKSLSGWTRPRLGRPPVHRAE